MKVREIFDLFRNEVDDTRHPPQWSDNELFEYLNDAENEAARRARLIVDSTTTAICQIPVVIGTSMYALDPRIIFIRRAKLASKSLPLGRKSYRDLDTCLPGWDSHTGTVQGFITDLETGKIRLYRSPTATDTLLLTVVRLPLQVMDDLDDTPEIHTRHHRNLRHWMRFRAYSKEDAETKDDAKAAKGLALFEQEFGKASTAIDELWIEQQQGYDPWDGTF